MKILLLSDTHGSLSRVYEIYEKLSGIDLILHCGDYQSDAYQLEDNLGVPVVSVRGNCDGAMRPDRKVVETPHGRILITHGHTEGAGFSYDKLLYAGEEENCIAVCFGHTHVAMNEDFGGIRLINPGSLSEPRDGSGGTYAILRSTEEEFYANIVRYDRICGTNGNNGSGTKNGRTAEKQKTKGGFLRDLLNYSDRF